MLEILSVCQDTVLKSLNNEQLLSKDETLIFSLLVSTKKIETLRIVELHTI